MMPLTICTILFLCVISANIPNVTSELTPVGEIAKCVTGVFSTSCENGFWPTLEDAPLPIHDSILYVGLDLKRITLRVHNFQPLPFRENWRNLRFTNLISIDRDGKLARFPLQDFTKLIPREKISSLSLEEVNLTPGLSESDFQDFTGLTTISFRECNIREVHPRTFYAVATPVMSESGAVLSYPSNLQYLSFHGPSPLTPIFPDSLRTFPWDSLVPVAGSIESISIMLQKDMTAITYTQPIDGSLMYLNKLRSLTIAYTKVADLSQAVVDTLNGTTANTQFSKDPVLTEFNDNGNKCGSCELVPLVKWARLRTDSDRKLKATCVKNGYGHLEYLPETVDYWLAYPIADCKEVVEFPPTTIRPPTTTRSAGSRAVSVFYQLLFVAICFSTLLNSVDRV